MSPGRTGPHRLHRPAGRMSRKSIRRSSRSNKSIEILHNCWSEPLIFPATGDDDDYGGGRRSSDFSGGELFYRMHTLNDLYLYPPELSVSPRGRNNAGYEKDAKVVITVTVEGSPGPIRSLVKLGTNVEDTIKLVIQKYAEEGRTPQLDKNSSSSFDLHVSYFSLQSLERSNTIGEIGSRSFYLRRGNYRKRVEVAEVMAPQESSPKRPRLPMVVLPSFITRKVGKFMRRMRKFFRVFGCLHSM